MENRKRLREPSAVNSPFNSRASTTPVLTEWRARCDTRRRDLILKSSRFETFPAERRGDVNYKRRVRDRTGDYALTTPRDAGEFLKMHAKFPREPFSRNARTEKRFIFHGVMLRVRRTKAALHRCK